MEEPKHPDLFSDEPTPIGKVPHGHIQKLKRRMKYRQAEPGEPTCKTCSHCMKLSYHGRNYYKCELIGDSRSEATDIRLKDTCKYHNGS